MVKPLEEVFSALAAGGFRVTSPVDKRYNCIAFAAGDTTTWWWPLPEGIKDVYWPVGVPCVESVAAFRDAFASIGYAECDAAENEEGFEKVALFANAQGFPLHAARQLSNGRWTSKLGEREDIEHELRDLEGESYGTVVSVMKRPISAKRAP
jgi:hypothetical protein